ncbi:MAG TPA: hypothetical protein VHW69_07885 [Rhizomicrobium sp.]|jgi:uncharacterized metal-binding protein YceD (DUF177 family)|nr:hypothetical protein [Rhizomicrobium sp.]
MKPAPFSVIYDLSDLSNGGAEISISATDEQRARLAEWAGIDSVEKFKAQVALTRMSATRFGYEAALSADVTQSCVVSLGPVHSQVALDVSRALHLTKIPPRAQVAVHELSSTANEGPEEIQNSHYDLAGPLLEEFLLAIDPYPRASGVVFEPPQDRDASDSPFAVLKPLKKSQ